MTVEIREIYTPELVFEHLFPGNRFQDLPPASFDSSLKSLVNLALQKERIKRNTILDAAAFGERCILVDRIDYTDQFWTSYFLRDLEPTDRSIHSSFYGISFENYMQKGEKLGGVAKRKLKWDELMPLAAVMVSLTSPKFGTNMHETILGVVNEDGKPSSLIHFIDGDNLKKREEKEIFLRQNLLPDGLTI